MQQEFIKPLFSWRSAICGSDLPPTTRHVLLTLGLWMNEMGRSCYPTIMMMSEATGLSERSVRTQLGLAEEQGWISRRLHGFGGQKWKNYEYEATIPASFWEKKALKEVQQLEQQNKEKLRNDVPQLSPEGAAPRSAPLQEGAANNDMKVRKDVPLNTPSNTPVVKNPPVSPLVRGEPRSASQDQPQKPETNPTHFVQTGRMTFTDFLDACAAAGVKPIPEDDDVFAFADRASIPIEFVKLAWAEFKSNHTRSQRPDADWRGRFGKLVAKMGGGLWRLEGGQYVLTGRGEQARRLASA